MKTPRKVILALAATPLFAIGAHAQSTSPEGPATALGIAVSNADNNTALQVNTGDAVQKTCGQLVPTYGGSTDLNASAEQSLFIHCGEMVGNANDLNAGQPGGGNSLGFNNEQLAEAMQQLTGEEGVSQGRLATESSNGQFGNIGMRLDAIRSGARATAGGLNVVMNGAPVSGGNAGDDGTGWGWFLNGALGTGDRDASTQENEYEYDSYGATLGFDYQFDSGFVAGFALGYTDYEVEFENVKSFDPATELTNTQAGGGFDTDGYSLSGYAIGNVGRFYIDGVMSFGQNDYSTERIVRYTAGAGASGTGAGSLVNRSMRGETDSDTFTLGASTGTTFDLGAVDLAVSLGISYLDVTVDGYTEKDIAIGTDTATFSGLNLAYEDQDFDSLQSSVGFQISKVFSTSSGVILPYVKAEWRHEFENEADTMQARYASQDIGQTFNLNVNTDDPDEDYFEVGLGVSAAFAQNIQAFIDYSTTLDLEDVSAELLTIGIRGQF
ncbi:MAG: outer membrane lipase/esterase [Bacteroidia bacterium]|jgi:outer membrane lipase/esterase